MAKEKLADTKKECIEHFTDCVYELDVQSILLLQVAADVLLARNKQIELSKEKESVLM